MLPSTSLEAPAKPLHRTARQAFSWAEPDQPYSTMPVLPGACISNQVQSQGSDGSSRATPFRRLEVVQERLWPRQPVQTHFREQPTARSNLASQGNRVLRPSAEPRHQLSRLRRREKGQHVLTEENRFSSQPTLEFIRGAFSRWERLRCRERNCNRTNPLPDPIRTRLTITTTQTSSQLVNGHLHNAITRHS